MSTETDTSGEDRVLRLLDDEGARWRAGYQPPSFDDAVRRLALPGDEGARIDDPHEAPVVGARRTAWWRPALIAAAVLVLVAGAVGAVAGLSRGHTVVAGPDGATLRDSRPSIPTLSWLPPGFALATGAVPPVPTARTDAGPPPQPAAYPTGAPSWVVTYDGPRLVHPGVHETLVLRGWVGSASPLDVTGRALALVGGHVAVVDGGCNGALSACGDVALTWVESPGVVVSLRYTGPSDATGYGDTLAMREVFQAAGSVVDGAPLGSPSTAQAPLPASVVVDGRTLRLWTTRPLEGAILAGSPLTDHQMLTVAVPELGSGAPNYCRPYDLPVLTKVDDAEVDVTVGLYVETLPTQLHPCPQRTSSSLVSSRRAITLGEALDDRRVVDGVTGKTVGVFYDD